MTPICIHALLSDCSADCTAVPLNTCNNQGNGVYAKTAKAVPRWSSSEFSPPLLLCYFTNAKSFKKPGSPHYFVVDTQYTRPCVSSKPTCSDRVFTSCSVGFSINPASRDALRRKSITGPYYLNSAFPNNGCTGYVGHGISAKGMFVYDTNQCLDFDQ